MKFMRTLFAVRGLSAGLDLGLFVLRVVVGLAFVKHGWGKIHHPMTWMGDDAFAPGPLQAAAAVSEFCGGIAMALGLLTPLAALGILCTMATATYVVAVKNEAPFVSPTGGASYELSAAYFCVAFLLLLAGPGRLSADRLFFGRRGRTDNAGAQ